MNFLHFGALLDLFFKFLILQRFLLKFPSVFQVNCLGLGCLKLEILKLSVKGINFSLFDLYINHKLLLFLEDTQFCTQRKSIFNKKIMNMNTSWRTRMNSDIAWASC
jgi:hypothetical protein